MISKSRAYIKTVVDPLVCKIQASEQRNRELEDRVNYLENNIPNDLNVRLQMLENENLQLKDKVKSREVSQLSEGHSELQDRINKLEQDLVTLKSSKQFSDSNSEAVCRESTDTSTKYKWVRCLLCRYWYETTSINLKVPDGQTLESIDYNCKLYRLKNPFKLL